MSKINIGVGDEFPLDENPDGEDRHARRHHHHHRHGGHVHHHRHPGAAHLPLLIIAVAIIAVVIAVVIAVLTGAVKIPLLAAHPILAVAGLIVLLIGLAHWHLHRHHRHGEEV